MAVSDAVLSGPASFSAVDDQARHQTRTSWLQTLVERPRSTRRDLDLKLSIDVARIAKLEHGLFTPNVCVKRAVNHLA